jgi:hypothetical protein
MEGRVYYKTSVPALPRLAVSRDGKRMYMLGMGQTGKRRGAGAGAVFRFDPNGRDMAKVFCGNMKAPGSDNDHFNDPTDVCLDAEERLYVADRFNNRIQVFSSDGGYLKSVKVGAPRGVQVHHETGEMYVLHSGHRRGKSTSRVTKFSAFPALKARFSQDDMPGAVFALDSWVSPPRLWIGSEMGNREPVPDSTLVVWKEDGKGFVKTLDFAERVRKDAGENYHGRWCGSQLGAAVRADPVRERVYVGNFRALTAVFDLKTGRFLGHVPVGTYGTGSTIGFDKKGFMHKEAPYHYVARMNPDRLPLRRLRNARDKNALRLDQKAVEVPYDYGVDVEGWIGAIRLHRVDYHPCGVGVNMRGDVAVVYSQNYAPRVSLGYDMAAMYSAGSAARGLAERGSAFGAERAYARLVRGFEEAERTDMELPYIRRRPGLALSGGTVWTWHASGELRTRMAVIAGSRINGVQMDEDGCLYFSNDRLRLFDGKPFLQGRAWRPGSDRKGTFFTGAHMKTRGGKAHFVCRDAPVKMDRYPSRPAELGGGIGPFVRPNIHAWAEGTEWAVAGVSPMKPADCMCYQIRAHLDWFKRSYIPERYRHSVGVYDTGGNLVVHVGRYGNIDSGAGPKSRVPLGGDGVATSSVRHIGGTDNHLVFDDWAERVVSVRLGYHAEEEVGIKRGNTR